jgi:hypothetical protein
MPLTKNIKLSPRDIKTLRRIETVGNSSNVLMYFFQNGFRSFDALKAIVLHFYPEVDEKRLWNFWHFRQVDENVCDVLESVVEKLKAE